MQQSQVLTYGITGVLGERLREFAQANRIRLRETNQLGACRNLLQLSPPTVFVLVLGSDLEIELALLELVHASLPATVSIAIGEADNPALAGLTWELGATYALFPPTPIERIIEILAQLAGEGAMSKASKNRIVESLWGQVELPAVDETLCTSCGWCVEVCPTQCLAMSVHLPCLPRPLDCVSCSLCALICPATAIRMEMTE